MTYQATKRHGGALNTYCEVEETSLVPTVRHCGKGTTVWTVKRSVIGRSLGRSDRGRGQERKD